MSDFQQIKVLPKSIEKIDYKLVSDDFLKVENVIGYDEDNDEWVIGMLKYFFINLTEYNKDIDFSKEQLNDDKMNETLMKLYKSKNLNLKNELILYLDHIETNEFMRRCGIATEMLDSLKEVAKKNNCKAIVLNAIPIILLKNGIRGNLDKSKLNDKKAYLKRFYEKRGFTPINKTSTLMYLKL